jgi:hypothetical protein
LNDFLKQVSKRNYSNSKQNNYENDKHIRYSVHHQDEHIAPIYSRVIVDGRRIEISLKKWIDPKEWNNKKGMAKAEQLL